MTGKAGKRGVKPAAHKSDRPRTGADRRQDPGFPVVGIGGSAGALAPLRQFLRRLPANTGMAFVVIQHLDPQRPTLLPEILKRELRMPISQAGNGERLLPNCVYIAPPATILELAGDSFKLRKKWRGQSTALDIDHFFTSLAETVQNRALGVILSGTGTDGALGVRAIKVKGGVTFAQAPAKAEFPGMPQAAIATGAVDFILPPEAIAGKIARLAGHPYLLPKQPQAPGTIIDADALQAIFVMVREATGVDFSHYKQPTILRRISRRLALLHIHKTGDYLARLKKDKHEAAALFEDFLIHVTGFFRDFGAFDLLKKKVFPRLVADRERDNPIRIWIPGCATGEEAYSLAITLLEYLREKKKSVPVQFFATDLSDSVIERARRGIYSSAIRHDVPAALLATYFEKTDGKYRVTQALRELMVFATQNLIGDPPFSNLDLISCRNLLIYLDPEQQNRLLPLFHFALKPDGFLLLGRSESVGRAGRLFATVDQREKLFRRREAAVRPVFNFTRSQLGKPPIARPPRPVGLREAPTKVEDRVAQLMLQRYAPTGVLLDCEFVVLQFWGQTGPYLSPVPGKASLNIFKIAREELVLELRAALHQARRTGKPVSKPGLIVTANAQRAALTLVVLPLSGVRGEEPCYLVLFEKAAAPARAMPDPPARHDKDNVRLERELTASREYLQSVIEDQEGTNEELTTAYEEIQSSNEELQSTNEELETAKQELQSTNEELRMVNEELKSRNEELLTANNDIGNLLHSVNLPVVMLDGQLRLRRLTKAAEKRLGLSQAHIGQPLAALRLPFPGMDLRAMARRVMETLVPEEREVRDLAGRWHSLQIRPYRTAENKIEGVVLAFFDIDPIKRGGEALRRERDRAQSYLDLVEVVIVALDLRGKVLMINRKGCQLLGHEEKAIVGKNWFTNFLPRRLRAATRRVAAQLRRGEPVTAAYHENPVLTRSGQERLIAWHNTVLRDERGRPVSLLSSGEDITERRAAEERVRDIARFPADNPNPVIRVDRAARVLYTNAAGKLFLKAWGCARNRCVPDLIRREIGRTLRGGKPRVIELEREGTVFLFTLAPVDEMSHVNLYGQNISERKAIERKLRLSEQRYALAQRAAQIGTWDWELARGTIVWSEPVAPMFGLEPGVFDGKFATVVKCLHPEDRVRFAAAVRRDLKHGRSVTTVFRVRHPDGTIRWLESQGQVLRDPRGKAIRLLGIVRDITGQKEDRERITRQSAELAEANRELRSLDEMKTNLLANVTHELRTPLVTIQGYTELIAGGASGPVTDKQKEQLGIMLRNSKCLTRRIDTLLHFSRHDRGRDPLLRERCDLREVLAEADDCFRLRAEEKGIILRILPGARPLAVAGDRGKLGQIIDNLLDNAMKFTPAGGKVTVRGARTARKVTITVSDSGIGIAPEHVDRVCERFYQADASSTRAFGGTGLGLAIARDFIRLHGGDIRLTSAPGRGTAVTVTLPRADQEPSAKSRPTPAKDAGAGKVKNRLTGERILIVDDDPDILVMLKEMLGVAGASVTTVTSAAAALRLLRRETFALILLDIAMPVIDGLELCRRLKRNPRTRAMPVIMVTAQVEATMPDRARDAGADGFIAKPFRIEELLALVKNRK